MPEQPQDQRLALPWNAMGGQIWATPKEQGAAPIAVSREVFSPPVLSQYLASLHNTDLHARQQLPLDASAAADEYMATQYASMTPHDTVGLERVRDGYVDGYKEGWREGVHISREEAENDKKMIASLKAQVDAAYARAEAMQETIEQWRGSSDTLKKQRDDETAARAFQEQELKRVIRERDAALAELKECREANVTWQRESNDLQAALRSTRSDVITYRGLAEQGAKAEANLRELRVTHAELSEDYEELLDDARIIASLGTAPGAREAAMKRVRARSGAVQDHLEEFEQEVAAGKGQDPTGVGAAVLDALGLPEMSVRRGGMQFPAPDPEALTDAYDRAAPLHGQGHHTPSYAEGYRNGRNDIAQAFREPMDQRDQALYAAHLLLAESVAARPETRVPYQRAVRRWQDEYVTVFGTPEEDA